MSIGTVQKSAVAIRPVRRQLDEVVAEVAVELVAPVAVHDMQQKNNSMEVRNESVQPEQEK